MVSTPGTISAVFEERVVFSYEQMSSCDSCKLKSGCGQSLVNRKAAPMSEISVTTSPEFEWRVGDCASLQVSDYALTVSVLIGYMVPIVAMVLAAVLATFLHESDGVGALAGIVGFLIGSQVVRRFSQRHASAAWMQPVVVPEANR